VGKKSNPSTTHPVEDLALKVAGGWWTRFTQMPFRLQLLNMSYFNSSTADLHVDQQSVLSLTSVFSCHTDSVWSLDSLCITCTAHQDASSHDGVVHIRRA